MLNVAGGGSGWRHGPLVRLWVLQGEREGLGGRWQALIDTDALAWQVVRPG